MCDVNHATKYQNSARQRNAKRVGYSVQHKQIKISASAKWEQKNVHSIFGGSFINSNIQ